MSNNRKNLFVCMGNVDRSRAGEIIFRLMLGERGFKVGKLFNKDDEFDFYVGSAGTCVSAPDTLNGSIQLTREMTRLADRIFSLDEQVTRVLLRDYQIPEAKLIAMHVQDGRSLLIEDQAKSLYDEFRRRLERYMPRR